MSHHPPWHLLFAYENLFWISWILEAIIGRIVASLLYSCSVRTIWRLIRRRLETGSLGNIHLISNVTIQLEFKRTWLITDLFRRGRGRKNWVEIPTVELELLLQELQTDPTLYLSEMADFWFNAGYPAYSPCQIWVALKSRNITRKVLEVHAREQNERKRQEFLKITGIYTAEQRFYVDERWVESLYGTFWYGNLSFYPLQPSHRKINQTVDLPSTLALSCSCIIVTVIEVNLNSSW